MGASAETLKVPIAPMGFSHALCLQGGGVSLDSSDVDISFCTISGNQAEVRAALSRSKVSIAPMGDSRLARCLQSGGGVYVGTGTLTITSSSITGNTVNGVRAHVQKFLTPRREDC